MLGDVLDKWRRGQTGPLPHLTSVQLLRALILIDERSTVGRRMLAQELELTDGVVRGLLERLAEQGIVEIRSLGASLTSRGKSRLQRHLGEIGILKIRFLDESKFAPGKLATAIQLRGKYRPGMTGVPQRDAAIKSGADGSITIGVETGRMVLPPDNRDAAEVSPYEDKRLRETFAPADGDLIVIGFAGSRPRSLTGALAAVLTIAEP